MIEFLKPLDPSRFVRFQTSPMLDGLDVREDPLDRQSKVPGYDPEAAADTSLLVVGGGGLTKEQIRAKVRKGTAQVCITDPDSFDPTNYPRQLCYAKDLYKNKGFAVAENLRQECLLATEILGMDMSYQDAREYIDLSAFSVILCNVDNNQTRVDVSRDARDLNIPAVFCGVSDDANWGYVFVQEASSESACFGCAFPEKINDAKQPCPGTPACADILKVIGGYAIYAIDSLLMPRKRNWNLRYEFMAGFLEDAARKVERDPNCELCGTGTCR